MRVATPQSRCRFGIARCDITPSPGIYHRMWGAARHDRSKGVHRPLTATAVYFANAGQASSQTDRQVLVAVDHCLLADREVDRIRAACAAHAGLTDNDVVVTFSHTHAAGLMTHDRRELPGGELIPSYLEELRHRLAGLVATALQNAVPADIVYGTGSCNLAANRDYYDAKEGTYVCGYNPHVAADATVVVARATDREGQCLANFVNYACHPTTLAWENELISPDFPGALRDTIEEFTAGPCVFLQGASGDLGPVEGYVGDPEIADRNGRQLAFAALSTFESLPPANTTFCYAGPVVSGALIGTWRRLANDDQREAELPLWRMDRTPLTLSYRDDRPSEQAVRSERDRLRGEEERARVRGDSSRAADLRALVERQTRVLARVEGLPPGPDFSYRTALWRIGDAVWVTLPGEPYNVLQRELRQRFPHNPLIVSTIANGWRPSYLPPQAVYGTGIYQETIALAAPGSLELVIDDLADKIERLLSGSS